MDNLTKEQYGNIEDECSVEVQQLALEALKMCQERATLDMRLSSTLSPASPKGYVPHDIPLRVVGIIMLNSKGILVQKHNGIGKLTIPSGKVDDGELPTVGAVREVFEETGLVINSGELIHLDSAVRHYKTYGNVGELLYLSTEIGGEPDNVEPEKHDWVKYMTPAEILEYDLPISNLLTTALSLMVNMEG